MNRRALVCIISAFAGISGSCNTPAAVNIRTAGHISAGSEAHERVATIEESPRLASCLAEGRTRFGESFVDVHVDQLSLDEMDCGECRLRIDIRPSEQPPWTDDVQPGYLYGNLTLENPSDSVLERLHDTCAEWGDWPRFSGICEWQRLPSGGWQSDMFAVVIVNGVPDVALVDLENPLGTERRVAPERYPVFDQDTGIVFEHALLASVLAHVLEFSGVIHFHASAVEVLDATDGRLLGCLPVSS